MRRRRTVSRTWLPALVALLGCARPSETVQTHDLLRRLPAVAHGAETTFLDVGTAAAGPFLHGLSWNESTEDGTTFSWSDGPTTAMDFHLAEVRPGRLVLRGFPWPGATSSARGAQTLDVALNGGKLGTLTMDGSVQELSLALSAETLALGRNRLQLTYSVVRRPTPEESEQRALGVAWDWARLELEPATLGGEEPFGDLLRDRLHLPAGSWIEYPLRIEPATELVIDRLEGDSPLVVSRRERLDGPSTELVRIAPGRNLHHAVSTETTGTVWLTFTNPGPGPLRLRAPRLETRRAP